MWQRVYVHILCETERPYEQLRSLFPRISSGDARGHCITIDAYSIANRRISLVLHVFCLRKESCCSSASVGIWPQVLGLI